MICDFLISGMGHTVMTSEINESDVIHSHQMNSTIIIIIIITITITGSHVSQIFGQVKGHTVSRGTLNPTIPYHTRSRDMVNSVKI